MACLAFALAPLGRAQLPAFPGAVGFGSGATGGRGGTVYHVTNLNDSGAGSFRDAVGASNRIIVFDVGGYIRALSPISTQSNLTIAGQTAPGGGIGIYGSEVSFYGRSNCIVRYVRFRDGSLDPNWAGLTSGSSHTNSVNAGSTTNLIFDHCCFEFAAYNNIDATACANLTIQYCIFSSPIKNQQFNGHFETGPMTFLANLWANAHNRNPLGKANLQYVNNVVYNYQDGMTTGNSAGKFTWDVINNYFIAGPSTSSPGANYFQVDANQSAYAAGNLLDSDRDGTLNGSPANTVDAAVVLGAPWSSATAGLPTLSAPDAFAVVLSSAGPLPRDQVDQAAINDARSLGACGKLYSTQLDTGFGNSGYGTLTGGTALFDSDGDGLPDAWESAVGLNPASAADAATITASGYTNLEVYLNWLAAPHTTVAKNTAAAPTAVDFDLAPYAGGFIAGATFSLSAAANGTVALLADGHTAHFVPTQNFSGLGSFSFTASAGTTSYTQIAGVLVTVNPPPRNLVWLGDGIANTWDSGTTASFLNGAAPTAFSGGDLVTFDDSGSTTPAVSLSGPVAPGALMVDAAGNYTFAGSGSLGGSGRLTKLNTGTLLLSNNGANTFTGGALIQGSTVRIASGTTTALGTGAVTLDSGTLDLPVNLANPLVITGSSLVNQSGSSISLSGTLTGGGVLTVTGLSSGRVFSLGGDMSGFTGTVALGAATGTLRLNSSSSNINTGGSGATFDLGSGSAFLVNRNGGTFSLGALTGGPGTTLSGASSNNATTTYSIGGAGTDGTFAGTVSDGSLALSALRTTAVTKVGAGTFTLSGPHAHTGNTTVSAGTLVVAGTLPGPVIVSGGTLSPGGPGNATTLTTGNLTLSGATLAFDLAATPAGPNDQLVVSNNGTLSVSGTETFLFNLTAGTLSAGTYTLASTTGALGAASGTAFASNLPAGTRQTFGITRNSSGSSPGYIRLNVSGTAADLIWYGKSTNAWDTTSPSNWSNGGYGDTFYPLDAVTFNDIGLHGNVTLSGTVQPRLVTLTNSALTYTLSGGVIAGPTALVKNGPGLATVSGSNTFTGGTSVNAGTLAFAGTSPLGTGNVTLNGGTLAFPDSGILANALAVPADSALLTGNGGTTLAGPLSGPGNLTVTAGSGRTLTLQGAADGYTGVLIVQPAGTLRLDRGAAAAWGLPNATLRLAGTAALSNRSTASLTVVLGALAGEPGTVVSASDQDLSAGSVCTLVVGGLNTDSTFGGTFADSANSTTGLLRQTLALTKAGTGTLTLSGASAYGGDTFVGAGTLRVSGSIASTGDFEVAAGATLDVPGGGIAGGLCVLEPGALLRLSAGTLTFSEVDVAAGAAVTGGGTIDGDLNNAGTVTVDGTGAQLAVTGNVTNSGTLRLTGGAALQAGGGTFTNTGVLDLLTGMQGLPAGLINRGTVIYAGGLRVLAVTRSGAALTVSVQSYAGHSYQLQRSGTLAAGSWINIGAAQAGTGGLLTFTDPAAPGAQQFYRLAVSP